MLDRGDINLMPEVHCLLVLTFGLLTSVLKCGSSVRCTCRIVQCVVQVNIMVVLLK
jgi:hypothetical protein